MSSESDVRSRYLALALDARRVIDSLILFVDEGKREEGLDQSLQQAINSLQAVTRKTEIFSPLRSRFAFSEYYEQVRTVEEALRPEERTEIVKKLSAISSNQVDMNSLREDAYQAIKLLSAIESRALYYYRPQP